MRRKKAATRKNGDKSTAAAARTITASRNRNPIKNSLKKVFMEHSAFDRLIKAETGFFEKVQAYVNNLGIVQNALIVINLL